MLGVSHDELVSLAKKHFAGLSSSDEHIDITPCRYTGSEVGQSVHIQCVLVFLQVRIRDDDMPYAHVVIAVEVRESHYVTGCVDARK